MKIAFISFEYPPGVEDGGIATYVRQAAAMLQKRGNLVEVFTADPHQAGVETEETGVRVHRIQLQIQDRKRFASQIAPLFAERHASIQFDVLEGPDFCAEAAEAVDLVPEIPLVVKLHTPNSVLREVREATTTGVVPQLKEKYYALKEWLNPHSLGNVEKRHAHDADVIASPSTLIGEYLINKWKLDRHKVHLFPLPYVPPSAFLDIPIEQRTNQIVTFVGRLQSRKGILDLAQAIPAILKIFPDAEFHFVGKVCQSPDSRQNMQEYIEELLHSYRNSLKFFGPVPNAQLPAILSKSDVCVFPSLFDSFGMVCLEAMAAGRAVVGSSASGMAEMINTEAVGRLVAPNCPQQIAEVVIELLKDPKLRVELGMAARERVLQEYSLERIGDLQEQSYRVAIEARQKSGSRRNFQKSQT